MKHIVQLTVITLFMTCFQGCAYSGVKKENSTAPLEQASSRTVRESPATVRRLLAKDMEDDMAKGGFPTKITVSGQDNTVLTYESPEITHEIYLNLTADAQKQAQWREMGFKRIIYKNGSDEWGFDLK
jgi:hypothetical protein